MHYQILLTCGLEIGFFKTSFFDNLLFSTIDVIVLFVITLLLSFFRIRISFIITFLITLVFSFCNVLYSRFFGQYISISSFGQIENLYDNTVIQSMLSGFEYYDLYYPIALLFFLWLLIKKRNIELSFKKGFQSLGVFLGSIVLIVFLLHISYFFKAQGYKVLLTLNPLTHFNYLYPNWSTFHKGFFRTLVIDNFIVQNAKNTPLTKDQIRKIELEYKKSDQRYTNHLVNKNIENVIFILVESYLSETSDKIVNGKEITPFLNSLKRDSDVYYNGNMHPLVYLGESSDGQFTYMTGLLPLRSDITISRVNDCAPLGLPRILKQKRNIQHTQIIVPTSATTWKQNTMNEVYGIDTMFSKEEYFKDNNVLIDLSDDVIFSIASEEDKLIKSPFFSLILTMSMHQPYYRTVDSTFILKDDKLPEKYLNYLNSCHFFDSQIQKYFNHLKVQGLYDKSLIIITSDHEAHPKQLDMIGKISTKTPLYIINGNIDKAKAWTGDFNQLDVYTTLLDILGIDNEWKGLGHSLLNPNYKNSVTEKIKKLSDEIIYGKYFSKPFNKNEASTR